MQCKGINKDIKSKPNVVSYIKNLLDAKKWMNICFDKSETRNRERLTQNINLGGCLETQLHQVITESCQI